MRSVLPTLSPKPLPGDRLCFLGGLPEVVSTDTTNNIFIMASLLRFHIKSETVSHRHCSALRFSP